jgi:hypothetical protein
MPAKLPSISEKEFQEQVIQLAQLRGWKVALFRRVRVQRKNGSVYWETPVGADGAGWPDLFCARGPDVFAAELKVGRNQLSEGQVEWMRALGRVGIRVYEWRPIDWPSIEKILEEGL